MFSYVKLSQHTLSFPNSWVWPSSTNSS